MEARELHTNAQREAASSRPSIFERDALTHNSHRLLLLFCFSVPLSIAASQTLIVILVVYALVVLTLGLRHKPEEAIFARDLDLAPIKKLATPTAYLILIALVATVAGVDSLRAAAELLKTSFYLLVPFFVCICLTGSQESQQTIINRTRLYLFALIVGQGVASLHTLIDVTFGGIIPLQPPGEVTEAGQLVLVFGAALALLFSKPLSLKKDERQLLTGEGIFIAFLVAGLALFAHWSKTLAESESAVFAIYLPVLIISGLFIYYFKSLKLAWPFSKYSADSTSAICARRTQLFIWFSAALLLAAMIINLKRGPWLGLLTELAVVGVLISRRLLLGTALVVVIILGTIPAVQERLSQLSEHFEISGGRKIMWTMGVELAQRYPLGVGLDNAKLMQKLDPTIPENHRHMHNNLLNAAVELGWLGMFTFIWLMLTAILIGFSHWRRSRRDTEPISRESGMLALVLSAGLLGWQVAGLVEYNFGDGEVRLIALLYMGLVLSLVSTKPRLGEQKSR